MQRRPFSVTMRAMARQRKPAKRKGQWLRWAGIAVAAFVVASVLLVLPLRWFDPATTMFMLLDDSGVEPIAHEWVDWDAMASAAPLAVVGSEDQRFADHFGVDLKAIKKAVEEQDERGYLRGASTISQQTVKNLYLWRARSFVRKGLEAWLTLVAEACLPKQRILEIYLNVAEFGPGIYGIGAASDIYFGKAPAALNDWETALLAAALPNPKALKIRNPSEELRERQAWIMKQVQRLRREGWLTRIEVG